jgi:hypothetical protein
MVKLINSYLKVKRVAYKNQIFKKVIKNTTYIDKNTLQNIGLLISQHGRDDRFVITMGRSLHVQQS